MMGGESNHQPPDWDDRSIQLHYSEFTLFDKLGLFSVGDKTENDVAECTVISLVSTT